MLFGGFQGHGEATWGEFGIGHRDGLSFIRELASRHAICGLGQSIIETRNITSQNEGLNHVC